MTKAPLSRRSLKKPRSGRTAALTRRTHAERSSETQTKVMQAALKVLAERGYAGFRIEAVVKMAGVSRGALLHHFPKKRDLIISTYEFLFSQLVQSSFERGAGKLDFDDLFDALMEDAEEFFLGEHFLQVIDILISAANEPDIRQDILDISKRSRAPVEKAWVDRLAGYLPKDVADDLVFMTFNNFRGFATRTFLQDDKTKFKKAAALWKKMVREHLEMHGLLTTRNRRRTAS